MALIDDRLELCDAHPLPIGVLGQSLVGDVIDLRSVGLWTDPPALPRPNTAPLAGDGVHLVVQVDEAATSGGAATAVFTLVSAATPSDLPGASNGHVMTGALPLAQLPAGATVLCVAMPRAAYERYLGLVVTVAGAALTGGRISAWLAADPIPTRRCYGDNVA